MNIRNLRPPQLSAMLVVFVLTCMATLLISFLTPQISRILVVSCWGIFMIFLIAYLLQNPGIGLLILVSGCLVGLGFVLPQPVAVWVLDYPNAVLDYFGFSISAGKLFHVIVYGLLGAGYVRLMTINSKLLSKLLLTMSLLVAMVMSEVFQLYVPNRSSSLKDISYNAIGIVIGAAVFLCVRLVSRFCNNLKRTLQI